MTRSRVRRPRGLQVALTPLIVVVGVVFGTYTEARAEDPATEFKQTCMSCHTIGGGRLVGPDLKNVHERRDRAWLVRFIVEPGAVLDSGDPYAAQLLLEAGNVRMPNVAGMTRSRAEGLLDLIEAESKLEKSRFVGLQVSMRPFTPKDVEVGESLFRGTTRLENGGTACISCHTLGGLGGLGGGRLGPDLTRVSERYETRLKLASWLSAPATETMLPTFKDFPIDESELLPLVAYFDHALNTQQEDESPRSLVFVLLGVGGAVVLILLFDWIWRRRFRGVRKSLVQAMALEVSDREVSISTQANDVGTR